MLKPLVDDGPVIQKKLDYRFILLGLACLLIMTAVDYWLAETAEFLNAWSVVERFILGNSSSHSSMVFQRFGATGEFIIVLMFNMVLGALLTALLGYLLRRNES